MFAIANCDGTFTALLVAFAVGWFLLKVYRTIDSDGSITAAIRDAGIRVLSKVAK